MKDGTTIPRCFDCETPRKRPLYFLSIDDNPSPMCHKCVIGLIEGIETPKLGAWTLELSGAVTLTKVR